MHGSFERRKGPLPSKLAPPGSKRSPFQRNSRAFAGREAPFRAKVYVTPPIPLRQSASSADFKFPHYTLDWRLEDANFCIFLPLLQVNVRRIG